MLASNPGAWKKKNQAHRRIWNGIFCMERQVRSMGLFSRKSDYDQLKEIDDSIRRAEDGLTREIVRSYLIIWWKQFGRLSRTVQSKMEESYQIRAAKDCVAMITRRVYPEQIQNEHNASASIAMTVSDILADRQKEIVGQINPGFRRDPVGTLINMADDGSLQEIIDYIDDLSS